MTPFSITDVKLVESIITIEPGVHKITIEAHSLADLKDAIDRHIDQVDKRGGGLSFSAPAQLGLGWFTVGELHEFEIENAPEVYMEEK